RPRSHSLVATTPATVLPQAQRFLSPVWAAKAFPARWLHLNRSLWTVAASVGSALRHPQRRPRSHSLVATTPASVLPQAQRFLSPVWATKAFPARWLHLN
ncbi:unnamed protein product, partial [Symbiodinium sp. CCMP2592]